MGERAVGYYMGKVPEKILSNFTGANATEIQEYVAEINVTYPPNNNSVILPNMLFDNSI